MRQNISISLPEKLSRQLDRAAKRQGMSRSELVRRSLRAQLYLEEIEDLRRKMTARARAQGMFTDEDVFAKVS